MAMTSYLDILSILILLSSFVLVANKKTTSYIKTFRLQSLLIALGMLCIGAESFANDGRIDAFILCLLIVVLKVIWIPNLLNKTYDRVVHKVEKDFFFNIPILTIICIGLVVFVYFMISGIGGFGGGDTNMQIVNMISVVLIGVFFMATRKKAIGQIVGFLVVENGIFGCAMFATSGMPLIVDLGIFIDLLTGVLIMGLMVFKINEMFESTNTNRLKRLRG